MRRLIFAGAIALVATVGLTAPAITRTRSENFKFNYDSAYGHKGLSRPYTGPKTTGQSYGTGVVIDPSDPSQKVYTLVEVNPNIGVGGPRGAFPASSRTIPPSSTPANYLGPYSIVRRTSDGAIDTTFGRQRLRRRLHEQQRQRLSIHRSVPRSRHRQHRHRRAGNDIRRPGGHRGTPDPAGQRLRHGQPGHQFQP